MIIEAVATHIAAGIKRQVPNHKASLAVLKHGITIVLNIVLIVLFTLAVSVLTGNVNQAAIALFGFAILRQFSGGVHVKTGAGCIFITTVLFTAISFIDLSLMYVQVLNFAAIVLVALFAPSRIEKQSRIKKQHYPKLRLISCVIVATNFLILSPTLALVYVIQALSLIPGKEVKTS